MINAQQRINSLRCEVSSLLVHGGLWQADRTADLWVHGLVALRMPASGTLEIVVHARSVSKAAKARPARGGW